MVLFETVRDLRFADNIENALSSIDNELKKANLLKERELELKDKEIKSKKLFYKLKVKGVYITPGAIFYRELNLGESYFKIGFSQVTEDEISRGINIIREGFKQWHI